MKNMYKLLKDVPCAKAGTFLYKGSLGDVYTYLTSPDQEEAKKDKRINFIEWAEIVENNPDWFARVVTLGDLVSGSFRGKLISYSRICKQTGLSESILPLILDDKIYPNCVPIMCMLKLLKFLSIPINEAVTAIRETYDLLKSQETDQDRKKKSHGYELWENKESLEKYINRLIELDSSCQPEKPKQRDWEIERIYLLNVKKLGARYSTGQVKYPEREVDYNFLFSHPIPQNKSSALKQAIENALNNDNTGEGGRRYTEKEMLQREEMAFNAAKEGQVEKIPVIIDQYGGTNIEEHFIPNKYPTFSDYKNSQSK